MADLILKSSSGKIWKNGNGKIIKAKPFSQIPIQEGLSFWGQADPALLTLVDGKVSEAYDVRDGYGGTRKMIQSTVSLRPEYTNNMIYFDVNSIRMSLTKSGETQNTKSIFIVLKIINSNLSPMGLGEFWKGNADAQSSLGTSYNNNNYIYSVRNYYANYKYYYYNNNKKNTGSAINNKCILHSLDQFVSTNQDMVVGCIYPGIAKMELYEWGWYNRLLSEAEVVYNINCLNQKYKIF